MKKLLKNYKIGKKERIQLKNLERESVKVIIFEANNKKDFLRSGKSEEKLEI